MFHHGCEKSAAQELLIFPEQRFLKIFFPKRKEGGDYGVERITNIKKGIGHKFWSIPPSLQPLHFWFMFYYAII